MTDPADTNVHGTYREAFTRLLAINPALAEAIQAMPITTAEKTDRIEAELAKVKS